MWIRLKNIPIYAFHGAYAHEQEFGTRFEVDVEIEADLSNAAKSDSLHDTIDYAKVHELILKASQSERYTLLEAWATNLAEKIESQFPLTEQCIIRIRKPGGSVKGLLDAIEVELQTKRHHAQKGESHA